MSQTLSSVPGSTPVRASLPISSFSPRLLHTRGTLVFRWSGDSHSSRRRPPTIRQRASLRRRRADGAGPRFRAEWIESRTRLVEEAASPLADSFKVAIVDSMPGERIVSALVLPRTTLVVGGTSGSGAFRLAERAPSAEGRRDLVRSRSLLPLAARFGAPPVISERHVSESVRRSAAGSRDGERRAPLRRPTPTPPAPGNRFSWSEVRPFAGIAVTTLSVPVRSDRATLLGHVELEVDAGRLVHESFERTEAPGDLWLAIERLRPPDRREPAGGGLLGCSLDSAETLAASNSASAESSGMRCRATVRAAGPRSTVRSHGSPRRARRPRLDVRRALHAVGRREAHGGSEARIRRCRTPN